jgi:hypothetical protein
LTIFNKIVLICQIAESVPKNADVVGNVWTSFQEFPEAADLLQIS